MFFLSRYHTITVHFLLVPKSFQISGVVMLVKIAIAIGQSESTQEMLSGMLRSVIF